MILYLAVRVGQVLERAVADGDAPLQSVLDLTVKQNLSDLVLVIVFVFEFVYEYDPCEVVLLGAVLSDDIVCLFTL